MNRPIKSHFTAALVTLCSLVAAGCSYSERESVHAVTPAGGGHHLGCRLCYDEMVRVVRGPPKYRRNKFIKRHRCADCMTEVAFYADNDGRVTIRCARCAPEGKPCDQCLPPVPPDTQRRDGVSTLK